MSQREFELIDTSEGSDVPLQTLPSSSQSHQPSHSDDHEDEPDHELVELFRAIESLFKWENCMSNTMALCSRFIQLVHRPEQLAPLILDIYSLSMSILLTGKQPGADFLYPLSSLTKRQSGRLARLILDHSKDVQQRNIREATSCKEGIDPPRVAVIDLSEGSSDAIERGYSVPADIHGFMIMLIILQALVTLCLHIFAYIDAQPIGDWIGDLVSLVFGERMGSSIGYLAGLWYSFCFNLGFLMGVTVIASLYAILRGDGVLHLVQRSDASVPGYAVFLDSGFTVILTGNRSVVEAIAESGFSISHPVSWRIHRKGWLLGQHFCYEVLKALCKGILFALFVGCWLLFHPSSLLSGFASLVPVVAISLWSSRTQFQELRHTLNGRHQARPSAGGFLKQSYTELARIVCRVLPSILLLLAYELAVAKEPFITSLFRPAIVLLLQYTYIIPFGILIISSQDFHIRTAKLLGILGNPPVHRWEFDTLAGAAAFQCLVLCHSIPRPIKTMDVLGLLDTFVPDQTDVWKAWKRRVADRIIHEDEKDITFAPTLPTFGDNERQKRLKEFLDEAQEGHRAYVRSYHLYVPLYPTGLL